MQKHASQILRKMLHQEEMELQVRKRAHGDDALRFRPQSLRRALQALMEERGRNPSPSLEERIESAKRRAHQVRLKLLPDAVRLPPPPPPPTTFCGPSPAKCFEPSCAPPGGDAIGKPRSRRRGGRRFVSSCEGQPRRGCSNWCSKPSGGGLPLLLPLRQDTRRPTRARATRRYAARLPAWRPAAFVMVSLAVPPRPLRVPAHPPRFPSGVFKTNGGATTRIG